MASKKAPAPIPAESAPIGAAPAAPARKKSTRAVALPPPADPEPAAVTPSKKARKSALPVDDSASTTRKKGKAESTPSAVKSDKKDAVAVKPPVPAKKRKAAPVPEREVDTPEARATPTEDVSDPPSPAPLSSSELHARIAERAYLIAESRGWAPGNPTEDWLQAERETLAALGTS